MDPGGGDVLQAIAYLVGSHGRGFLQDAQKALVAHPLVRPYVGIGYGGFIKIVWRIVSLPQLKVPPIVLFIGGIVKDKFAPEDGGKIAHLHIYSSLRRDKPQIFENFLQTCAVLNFCILYKKHPFPSVKSNNFSKNI